MMEFGYVPAVPDMDLQAKLMREAAGILRWAIDGALSWGSTGLTVPASVLGTTDTFFDEQDLPGRWLKERVEQNVRGSRVQAEDLFKDWIEWRNKEGNHTELDNQTAFAKEMTAARGLAKARTNRGFDYLNVRLKSKAATAFDQN